MTAVEYRVKITAVCYVAVISVVASSPASAISMVQRVENCPRRSLKIVGEKLIWEAKNALT